MIIIMLFVVGLAVSFIFKADINRFIRNTIPDYTTPEHDEIPIEEIEGFCGDGWTRVARNIGGVISFCGTAPCDVGSLRASEIEIDRRGDVVDLYLDTRYFRDDSPFGIIDSEGIFKINNDIFLKRGDIYEDVKDKLPSYSDLINLNGSILKGEYICREGEMLDGANEVDELTDEFEIWGNFDEIAFAACFIKDESSTIVRQATIDGGAIATKVAADIAANLNNLPAVLVEEGALIEKMGKGMHLTLQQGQGVGVIKHFPEKGIYNIVTNTKGLPIGQLGHNFRVMKLSKAMAITLDGIAVSGPGQLIKGTIEGTAKVYVKGSGSALGTAKDLASMTTSKGRVLKVARAGSKFAKVLGQVSSGLLYYDMLCTGLEIEKEYVELQYDIIDAQSSTIDVEVQLGHLIVGVISKMNNMEEPVSILDEYSHEFVDEINEEVVGKILAMVLEFESLNNEYLVLRKKYAEYRDNDDRETVRVSKIFFWNTIEQKITEDERVELLNDYSRLSRSVRDLQFDIEDLNELLVNTAEGGWVGILE
ncbi:hypothetical protein KAR91_16410 [Candidatus Pacearchaeota archaeon]|nr:hypothetical protein [Candidatus Pacearchaeota archaeon]